MITDPYSALMGAIAGAVFAQLCIHSHSINLAIERLLHPMQTVPSQPERYRNPSRPLIAFRLVFAFLVGCGLAHAMGWHGIASAVLGVLVVWHGSLHGGLRRFKAEVSGFDGVPKINVPKEAIDVKGSVIFMDGNPIGVTEGEISFRPQGVRLPSPPPVNIQINGTLGEISPENLKHAIGSLRLPHRRKP